MKIAIVHDWLVTYAGAERVLEQMLRCYPDADLYAVLDFLPEGGRGFLGGRVPTTSFVQKMPFARRYYRNYLPLMTYAIEQFDLSGYDLVISSSHAVAKGVLTGPDQTHVSYIYSPMRYAWDLQHQYLKESGLDHGLKGLLARWMLHRMRIWDLRTVNGIDAVCGISHYIARRIRKVYGIDADVVYPPVDIDFYTPGGERDQFYLTVSRFVPYKKIDIIVDAFAELPDQHLVVIGDGPMREKVEKAAGANVSFLGYQSADIVRDNLRRARAFIFAAEEDFGIAPLEAQACGTPVIAYGKGGALETIKGKGSLSPTGIFFNEQKPASIAEAVREFERTAGNFSFEKCRSNAEIFNSARFRREFVAFVEKALRKSESRPCIVN